MKRQNQYVEVMEVRHLHNVNVVEETELFMTFQTGNGKQVKYPCKNILKVEDERGMPQ